MSPGGHAPLPGGWCLESHLWLLVIVGHLRTDPDITIVPEDDASSTEKVVEVILAAFDERWRYSDQRSGSKLGGEEKE